jgi:hypothetical protein
MRRIMRGSPEVWPGSAARARSGYADRNRFSDGSEGVSGRMAAGARVD